MVADAVAHRADFLELPEIEAAAPDEGLDRGEEILAERTVARRRAAADERRLLPRQRLGLIIGDRRIHGQHDRRHLGMRTQAQVDAQSSEEHTSELQSIMRISYAGFRLKKKPPILHHYKLTIG